MRGEQEELPVDRWTFRRKGASGVNNNVSYSIKVARGKERKSKGKRVKGVGERPL